jgi:hypothetical protein
MSTSLQLSWSDLQDFGSNAVSSSNQVVKEADLSRIVGVIGELLQSFRPLAATNLKPNSGAEMTKIILSFLRLEHLYLHIHPKHLQLEHDKNELLR